MNLPALKAALTRAQKTGDPRKVIDACDDACEVFGREGWPDCWHRWQRAALDAESELARKART